MTAKKKGKSEPRRRSRKRPRVYQISVPTFIPNIRTQHKQPQASFHPAFFPRLAHLTRRLAPLVSVTTAQPHPAFPKSLLQYHLLTSTKLDSLAAHYHQVIPSRRESSEYPRRITPWVNRYGKPVINTSLETKRRRFGRFIGLQGCESPSCEGMLETMERDWDNAVGRGRTDSHDEGRHALGRKI